MTPLARLSRPLSHVSSRGVSSLLCKQQRFLTRSSPGTVSFGSKSIYPVDSSRFISNAHNTWRLVHKCDINNNLKSNTLQLKTVIFGQKRWSGTNNSPEKEKSSERTELESKAKPRLLPKLPVGVHENIYTVPNLLTFSRLIAAPVVGYLLVHNHHAAALSLFAYAGITDLIDGYIARRYNLQTVVGTIIDPAADKLLMTISVVCLALNGSMPMWLAALILGRDVGLSLSAIYYRWVSLPPPKTMARYWDFSLPSAEVRPTGISKLNTALQLLLVGTSMALPVVPAWLAGTWGLHDGMVGLQYLVAFTTIASSISYMMGHGVKVLTKADLEKLKTRQPRQP
ncbi:CDP-alcohol phosphatidyltransferase-domain-containing protein [Talaromyces proteolyticus]|uniref:CDP-alcohol phosphatidyltransferase-domain-containing protein n=1 Tax=Talaromyces proteolyticus TaxID=1131652 RepID=A0AAD4KE15_9EURO|nr:CDP-alcohol phosphatidyltransferase-domain-containing protein [Talaromyces proteolyticus]KAH8689647.1 CDP-alcohol phosphatidyltransferase-domain-containing protein [Talaromyces proteolyticus]